MQKRGKILSVSVHTVFILLLFISQISFAVGDLFSIGWGTSEGELSIGNGGGIAIPLTGDVTVPVTPPSGGGGEEEPETTSDDFSLDKSFISVQVKKGVASQERITITNNRNTDLIVVISQENLTNIVFTEDIEITLSPGEKRGIPVNIYVPENEDATLLSGKITFQSSNFKKSVTLVLDIKEKAPLFDIKATLLRKIFVPGQLAVADIKILNLGDLKNIDVELESLILDSEENIYDAKKEMFAINDSFAGKAALQIPKNIPEGKYKFSSTVRYKNITANSYDSFDIIKSVISFGLLIFWLVILIFLTAITLIAVILKNQFRNY
jgi:uncharacterized membrane protein